MLPWEAAQFGLLDELDEPAQTPYNPVADLFIDWAQGVGGRIGGLLEPSRYPEEDAAMREKLQRAFLGDISKGELPDFGISGVVVGAKSGLFSNQLRQAKNLDKKGYSQDEIFEWSGWWKGPDGKWRHELSDADAVVPNQDLVPGLAEGKSTVRFLGDVMHHPELYKAYGGNRYPVDRVPVSIKRTSGVPRGGYNPVSKTMRVQYNPDSAPANPDLLKKLLLHETQHKIQDVEGFTQGANIKRAKTGSDEALLDLRLEIINNDSNLKAQLDHGMKLLESSNPLDVAQGEQFIQSAHNAAGMRIYRGTMGEVEARTVAKRHMVDPYEQQIRPFYTELDSLIPYQKQYNFKSLLDDWTDGGK
jgi:hypothetical protein